jgi:hypothetical protein
MDDKIQAAIIAAVIAAVVTLIGSILTFIAARRQTRAQIEIAREQIRQQTETKLNELTQTQFKDIIAKRIEVYPKLWCILQTFLSDWRRNQEMVNLNWVPDAKQLQQFFKDLMEWHQQNGVLLSEPSYRGFAALRDETFKLACKCNLDNYQLKPDDIQKLDDLYSIGDRNRPDNDPRRLALSGWLKNDLGSFETPLIALPTAEYKKAIKDTVTRIRAMLIWP